MRKLKKIFIAFFAVTILVSSGCNTGINTSVDIEDILINGIYKQGPINESKNTLDFAIDGKGFFKVLDIVNGKIYYTRDGSFHLDEKGVIVNKLGYVLDPPVSISAGQTFSSLSESGRYMVKEVNSQTLITITQLILAVFPNTDVLKPLPAPNNNIYMETSSPSREILSPPKLQGAGLVVSSALEDLTANKTTAPNQGCYKEINNLKDSTTLQKTEKAMDWAIDGKGFFKLLDIENNQILYTRNGSFHFDTLGKLRTKHGYYLDPPTTLFENQIFSRIDEEGRLFVKYENSSGETQIAKIYLVNFKNPEKLKPMGFTRGTIYLETKESGSGTEGPAKQNGAGFIVSGILENCTKEIGIPLEDWLY